MTSKSRSGYLKYHMCQVSINSEHLTGDKYFKKYIFDIVWAINKWLYADDLLYLDKLF